MNPRPLSPAHHIPRRRLTAYDLVILFGVPLVAYLGAAAAAAGFVVLAAFAALVAWGWPLVAVAAFLASAALLPARRGR